MEKSHKFQIRVYYEDTDAGAVVYYANYLKYAERARTEYLRDAGINQSELAANEGLFFVVRHAELDLMKPAKLDDLLTIKTSVIKLSGASLEMEQEILLLDNKLAVVKTVIACVDVDFKPARIPVKIKELMIK